MAAGMTQQALSCLLRLQHAQIDQGAAGLETLAKLYCYNLDLHPFETGARVVKHLLQKNKALVGPRIQELPALLGILGKHEDKVLELAGIAMQADALEAPSTTESVHRTPAGSWLSVKDTLLKLYEAREKQGDFGIAIEGHKKSFKVHSYVMCAAWPYFPQELRCGNARKTTKAVEAARRGL